MAAAVALGACGAVEDLNPDDFSGWQAKPMEPDRGLAEKASTDKACQSRSILLNATMPPPMALPMHVELQDRRTRRTAAFIVSTDGYVGQCFVSPVQTYSLGNLLATPIAALTGATDVSGSGSGILGAGEVSYIWGRTDARVATVSIDLGGQLHEVDKDDRVVLASSGGGYWLGWWPDNAEPNRVTSFDAHGDVVATLNRTDDGWVAQ
jgi:hypothetical protein